MERTQVIDCRRSASFAPTSTSRSSHKQEVNALGYKGQQSTLSSFACAGYFELTAGLAPCKAVWNTYVKTRLNFVEGVVALPLQTSQIAIPNILVSRIGTVICVLPEPKTLHLAGKGPALEAQRTIHGAEPVAIIGAGFLPVCGGVDCREPTSSSLVSVGEITDPINQRGLTQAVAPGPGLSVG